MILRIDYNKLRVLHLAIMIKDRIKIISEDKISTVPIFNIGLRHSLLIFFNNENLIFLIPLIVE